MVTYPKPRYGAMALGVLCALGAAGVLLEDIRHTHTVTLDHGLSVIVLIGTIASGVMTWQALKDWSLSAIPLALLAIIGTSYCVMSTAGRTAESRAVKQIEAETANKERTRLEAKRQEAEAMLDAERKQHAKECATGAGKNCTGIRQSIEVYEAAVKGHTADLAKLPLEQPVNTKSKNIAKIAAAAGFEEAKVEALVTLIDPNIPALFLEMGSIVFWHIFFASLAVRRTVAANDQAGRPSDEELAEFRRTFETDPEPPRPRKRSRPDQRRSDVADFVGAYRVRHGRDPEQHEVRKALSLPRSTTSRYYNEVLAG